MPNVCRFLLKKEKAKYKLIEIKVKGENFKKSKFNDQQLLYKNELHTIIIILESPHEKEYSYNPFIPIAPAQEVTGNMIFDKLENIINAENEKIIKLNQNEYRIVIINPIPFQTSLWHIHKQALKGVYATLRNNVWKTLWKNDNSYKTNFKQIICKAKPDVIINACTSSLTNLVKLELSEPEYKKILKLKICHPSSWSYSENNITLKAL